MKFYDPKRWKHLMLLLVAGGVFVPAWTWGINTVSEGFQVSSTEVEIDAHSTCNEVSSSSGTYFVPTKTSAEWLDFRNNKPASVTLDACVGPNGLGASCGGTFHGGNISVNSYFCANGEQTIEEYWCCDGVSTYHLFESCGAYLGDFTGCPATDTLCGGAHQGTHASAAAANTAGLCSSGTASPASLSDPGAWTWECTSGGTTSYCYASYQ